MPDTLEPLIAGHPFQHLGERIYSGVMEKYKLKKIELDVLYILSRANSEYTARDISRRHFISKAHISHAIFSLSSRGFIECIHDETDRRCIKLRLTEKAIPVLSEIAQQKEQLYNLIFKNITEEDKAALSRILAAMLTNMQEISNDR